MEEDHWQDKDIAQLAWFLVQGREGDIPKLSDPKCLLKIYIAHVCGFTAMLKTLIELTCSEVGSVIATEDSTKRTALTRLTKFSRTSIYQALSKEKIWNEVHPDAQQWLKGDAKTTSQASIVRAKRSRMWKKFLATRNVRITKLSLEERFKLRDEFQKEVWQPEEDKESSLDFRAAFKKATTGLRYRVVGLTARVSKFTKDNRLYSPEFREIQRRNFYLEQRNEYISGKITQDVEKNNALVKVRAKNIWYMVEDNRQSGNPDRYGFLLNDDGSTPSEDEIYLRLTDAQWLSIK